MNSLFFFDGNDNKKIIKWYQSAIGCLICPAVYICPDIVYSIGVLSCYCSNLGTKYCNLVIQIFRYLSGTLDLGIVFTADSKDDLVGYIKFDYAGSIDGQKSIGGYIFILPSRPLSHQLKLQSTITLSSTKAEYMATVDRRKKALYVAQFLAYLGFCLLCQTGKWCVDNKKAIVLIKNPNSIKRQSISKYVSIGFERKLSEKRMLFHPSLLKKCGPTDL